MKKSELILLIEKEIAESQKEQDALLTGHEWSCLMGRIEGLRWLLEELEKDDNVICPKCQDGWTQRDLGSGYWSDPEPCSWCDGTGKV